MRSRWQVLVIAVLVLAILSSLIYWWGTPRLLAVSPAEGAVVSSAGAQIQLTFSRQMRLESLQEHLTLTPPVEGTYEWQEKTLVFTPEAPWKAGTRVQVSLAPGVRAAGLFSFPTVEGKEWSFTVRQPLLAYLFPSDGPANLYLIDPQTRQIQQLTNHLGGVQDYSLLPDGSELYYSLHSGAFGSDIYRIKLDALAWGQAEESELPEAQLIMRCLDSLCRAVTVSPDGEFLAFERVDLPSQALTNYPRVWYIHLAEEEQGNEEEALLDLSAAQPVDDMAHQTLLPSWSPRGWLTYYDTNQAAFVVFNPRDGSRQVLPNQTGQPGSWHPDGEIYVAPEISFLETGSPNVEGLEAFANSHLLAYSLQGSAPQDLSVDENLEDSAPSFSPDGRYLVFARKFLDIQRWTPGRQLWLMDFLTRQAEALSDAPVYNHFDIVWSPGGEYLAFVRFDNAALTRPPEIWYLHPFEGWMLRLVVGGYFPQWIP